MQLTRHYDLHLHLQRGEQTRLALPYMQCDQSPLHEHLMSRLHALDTSGTLVFIKNIPELRRMITYR